MNTELWLPRPRQEGNNNKWTVLFNVVLLLQMCDDLVN